MERPIAHEPQFWSLLPNVLPQTVKNIAVEPGVHGLPFGGKHTARTAIGWLSMELARNVLVHLRITVC
jgi:hypothetical protein